MSNRTVERSFNTARLAEGHGGPFVHIVAVGDVALSLLCTTETIDDVVEIILDHVIPNGNFSIGYYLIS